MPYMTRYRLSVHNEKALAKANNPDYIKFVMWLESPESDQVEFLRHIWISGDRCGWYDHEEDIADLSKRFPDLVFELEGEGEYPRDIWIKYFKNSKMQKCPAKITFDKFSAERLKKINRRKNASL
jgi:hypothetical protein